jgi:hypothetical protein
MFVGVIEGCNFVKVGLDFLFEQEWILHVPFNNEKECNKRLC